MGREALKLSLGRGPYGEDLRVINGRRHVRRGSGDLEDEFTRRNAAHEKLVTVRLPAGIWVRPASVTKYVTSPLATAFCLSAAEVRPCKWRRQRRKKQG